MAGLHLVAVIVHVLTAVLSQNPLGGSASECCEAHADTLQGILQRLTSLEREVQTLKTENANLLNNSSSNVVALQNEIARLKSQQQPVAFFAELSNDMVNPSSGQTVVFDQILTNVGNAYTPSTGIFTVPLSGTYHFNVVLSSPDNGEAAHYMHFFLLQNGRKIAYLFLDHNTDYWVHTSSSTVVQAMKGDQIWLSVGRVGGQHTLAGHRQGEGEMHSHISGFLIQAI